MPGISKKIEALPLRRWWKGIIIHDVFENNNLYQKSLTGKKKYFIIVAKLGMLNFKDKH